MSAPAPARRQEEEPLVFMTRCPRLKLQRKHLEQRGFRVTSDLTPECDILVFCPDHLATYELSASRSEVPKLIVGGPAPAGWSRTESLTGPVLPAVLERHIAQILSRPAPQGATRYRILMIEDDPTVRAAATDALGDAGFEVATVFGFAAVLEEMKRRPDFILLDLNLPGLSGERLGEILRQQQIPTAIFSSEAPQRLEAARARLGAVAAFSKGTPLHLVAAQIRQHILDALAS